MSNYSQATNFTAKDALASGNAAKKIMGADIDAEFSAISTAIASKMDNLNTLSADISPDIHADYLVTYDASATSLKKVLMKYNNLGGTSLLYASSNNDQTISASTWTRIITLGTESYDLGGNFTNNKFTLTSANYDGYYLFFGSVHFEAVAGLKGVAVTRYNSSNVAQSRLTVQSYVSTTQSLILPIIVTHALTFSSGDYAAIDAYSSVGETLPTSAGTRFGCVRVSAT